VTTRINHLVALACISLLLAAEGCSLSRSGSDEEGGQVLQELVEKWHRLSVPSAGGMEHGDQELVKVTLQIREESRSWHHQKHVQLTDAERGQIEEVVRSIYWPIGYRFSQPRAGRFFRESP
jgi:hypothetical protein